CGLGQILAAHEATDRGTDQTLLLREVLVQRRELLEAERRSRHASLRVLSPRGGSHRGASTADVQPGLRTCTVWCRGAPLRRVAPAGWGLPTSPGRRVDGARGSSDEASGERPRAARSPGGLDEGALGAPEPIPLQEVTA